MLKFLRFGAEADAETMSSSSMSSEPAPDESILMNCRCCGTLIKFPEPISKYKCSVCHSTLALVQGEGGDVARMANIAELKRIIGHCHQRLRDGIDLHDAFKPAEAYIIPLFSSQDSLNVSFQTEPPTGLGVNYNVLENFFRLLIQLPTRRPFVRLLVAVNDLLRRPPQACKSAGEIRWLLILLEIPTLTDCLYYNRRPSMRHKLDTPEIKCLSYDIIKRVIGYLANSDKQSLKRLAIWLQSLPAPRFESKVQLINLYITFHLTRAISIQSNTTAWQSSAGPDLSEYSDSAKLNSASTSGLPSRFGSLHLPSSVRSGFNAWNEWSPSDSQSKQNELKLRVSQYGNDWHVKSAARLLSVFYIANQSRIPDYAFYNTISDYILVKQDFEIWQSAFKRTDPKDPNKMLRDMLNYGVMSGPFGSKTPQFTFCQFPFLLTLGSKISILEHEARRSMERKAEEAFISAMDSRIATSVNLVFQIRRQHLTNDSLRCIKQYRSDLKKALKIEFVGEPGVDAGGLKKEWFQLVTRALFSQENGMFFYNDESHMCWFAPRPVESNDELFYLVGVVLGLAIYNSTILDLRFPRALYKKLFAKKVTLDDYIELFPSTGKGLLQLLHCDDVKELAIYFETSFKDLFGTVITKELIPHGSSILVTEENRHDYVNRWVDFYMNQSISGQFNSFFSGFQTVIGGNALSLFSPAEIEMIICGNSDTRLDTESLKSITRYNGWGSKEDALKCDVVIWLWEWLAELDSDRQKKFLCFVTGSDRIPATGVSTMSFKITKLPSYGRCKLPVAHTCFNEICLYDYRSKEDMVRMLDISISESEGFGLR